ncbi:hypothetical protein FPOA_07290 [Fusarium poae]|uniref:Uncharacterized protein n=1 Tax=Fusarium poae TaxID=36050 RepID=A0A1B8AKB2_FUSPO|nr:hypothetical protein FPOA_07290 [Fusarium poae]
MNAFSSDRPPRYHPDRYRRPTRRPYNKNKNKNKNTNGNFIQRFISKYGTFAFIGVIVFLVVILGSCVAFCCRGKTPKGDEEAPAPEPEAEAPAEEEPKEEEEEEEEEEETKEDEAPNESQNMRILRAIAPPSARRAVDTIAMLENMMRNPDREREWMTFSTGSYFRAG